MNISANSEAFFVQADDGRRHGSFLAAKQRRNKKLLLLSTAPLPRILTRAVKNRLTSFSETPKSVISSQPNPVPRKHCPNTIIKRNVYGVSISFYENLYSVMFKTGFFFILKLYRSVNFRSDVLTKCRKNNYENNTCSTKPTGRFPNAYA